MIHFSNTRVTEKCIKVKLCATQRTCAEIECRGRHRHAHLRRLRGRLGRDERAPRDLREGRLRAHVRRMARESGELPSFYLQHNWDQLIGQGLEMREDDCGLWVRGRFIKSPWGDHALALVREKIATALSIGFTHDDYERTSPTGRTASSGFARSRFPRWAWSRRAPTAPPASPRCRFRAGCSAFSLERLGG